MSRSTTISRRDFIKLSAGGTLFGLGFYFGGATRLLADSPTETFQPNLWISISADDTVTITMHKSELGQKVWTALPQIVAEELEADWTRIKIVQGDFNPAYGSQVTGGSMSVRDNYDKLRQAGATAREMLITAAAQTWSVPRTECRAENNTIIHQPSGRKLSYGELVAVAGTLPIPDEVPLKDPRDFKIIGQAFKSVDHAIKIDGSAVFGLDFTVPGMLIAVVERIPYRGGALSEFDPQPALAVPGVKQVVPISSGIAVVATNTWAALEGRRALKVTWEAGPNAGLNSPDITAAFRSVLDGEAQPVETSGDADQAIKSAAKVISAEYEFPYLDHAPMEPVNCTAYIHDGICEVWVATQNPRAAFGHARYITGYANENIKVYTLRSGGGFGRRLQSDFVADAVEVARELGVPVKVFRTREEDIRHGIYRPATVHKTRGALDKAGLPTVWTHRIAAQTDGWTDIHTGGAGDLAYAIPNIKTDLVMADVPVAIGAWRSVGNPHNAFVNECFIDELAAAAGKNPLDYRLKLLADQPRHRGVLELAAEQAGWGKKLPKNHFQGLAVHYCFRSYAAVIAEIAVDKAGLLKIHRMVCAVDCGTVINPDGVRAQIEGGVTFGLTAALFGEISFAEGLVRQSNFHDYKLLSIKDAPQVDGYIVPSTEPPTGIGEPPVPPTAPALANAIFAATGKRIYRLPIGGFDLKKAGII
ncbi:MAG: xanthine dehydrogenase family protein molybdopterin-binding subunit [Candidatus Neomarinimicrobiota bacterium]